MICRSLCFICLSTCFLLLVGCDSGNEPASSQGAVPQSQDDQLADTDETKGPIIYPSPFEDGGVVVKPLPERSGNEPLEVAEEIVVEETGSQGDDGGGGIMRGFGRALFGGIADGMAEDNSRPSP